MAPRKPPLLRIPVELRLMIFEYLFDDGGHKTLAIRNRSRLKQPAEQKRGAHRRSGYHVIERSLQKICFKTTYDVETSIEFHTAIMATNRQIYHETAEIVYGRHLFDFGSDIEAVVPFFNDRLPETKAEIRQISLQKRATHISEGDVDKWAALCRYLAGLKSLKKIRLVIEGGKPHSDWSGPKELAVSDLRLLWNLQHGSMDWVGGLTELQTLDEIEIVPEIGYLSPPKTTTMLLYAAFSASISTSLVEFMRSDLQIPAVAGTASC